MPFDWTRATVTQRFGPTNEPLDSPYGGAAHFNKGIDYGVPLGTLIDTVVAGTVIAAGDQGDGWGISVKIRDAQGNVHNYGHLSGTTVKVGQTVGRGDVVGQSGNTGASSGPHVSYDVKDAAGNFFDPTRFVGPEGDSPPPPENQKPTDENWFNDYAASYARWSSLDKKAAVAEAAGAVYVPGQGWVVQQVDALGQVTGEEVVMLEADYFEYIDLEGRIADMEEDYETRGGDLNDAMAWAKYLYDTDPRVIDADNAASRFEREMDIRREASSMATREYEEQRGQQNDAEASFIRKIGGGVGPFRVPSANLPGPDQLFDRAVARMRKGLPEVPDLPYADRIERPDQMPSLAGIRATAGSAKNRLADLPAVGGTDPEDVSRLRDQSLYGRTTPPSRAEFISQFDKPLTSAPFSRLAPQKNVIPNLSRRGLSIGGAAAQPLPPVVNERLGSVLAQRNTTRRGDLYLERGY